MTYGDEPSLFRLSASAAAEGESKSSTNQLEDLPLFGQLEDPEDPEEFEQPTTVRESESFHDTMETHHVDEPWQSELEAPVEPRQLAADFSEPAQQTEVERLEPAESPPNARPATLTDRLGAALLDLAVMAGTAIALAGGAAVLGATPQLSDWPLLAFPWLLFSFLYHVVPMAFWGQTPGMASMSLTARTLDDRPLSLGQAIRRWLATLGTIVLFGLPALLALSGRSASDRLSQSATHWKPPGGSPVGL